MPVAVVFEGDGEGAVLICRGLVTGDELKAATDEIYRSDQFATLRYMLGDFTQAERLHISTPEVRVIADRDRAAATTNPSIRWVIAAEQDFVFGLARMWEALMNAENIQTHIFRTVAEAREWLGVPERGETPFAGR